MKRLPFLIAIAAILAGLPVLLACDPTTDPSIPHPVNMDAIEGIYPLDSAAKEKLLTNGFIVLRDYEYGYLSGCYFSLFYTHDISVFVTSDAMVHIFHILHDALLEDVERQYLYDSLELLTGDMQGASALMYQDTSADLARVKEAARRNVAFFTVACRLLDNTYAIPSYVEDDVMDYVEKILAHNTTEFYPGDDWTQYQPRGHYEGDPVLEKYFRCVKWLSRHILRIEDYHYPEDSDIEIIEAAIVSEMLRDSPEDTQLWEKIYDVTTLLVGPADSITPIMVQQAVASVFGGNFTISMLEDTTNIDRLREEFQKPEYPESQIIPVPLEYPGQIPPKYVQFMGERYVPDSYLFQQVTYPYIGDCTRLPKGLEVMAMMLGSHRADQLLEEEKDIYPELESQYAKLKEEFGEYTEDDWQKNVYCNWLYALEPLLVEFDDTYPLFMQNTAWQDEKLNTALSSWTQLRHDYILYAKQTSIPMPIAEGYGYVEPVPEFYRRLASLCRRIDVGLSEQGMLPEGYHTALSRLAGKLDTFETYAQKILDNEPLTTGDPHEGEQDDIHGFGLWLLSFFDGYPAGIEDEEPTLVVDVCTNSCTGEVLHEGVGRLNPIIIAYQEPDGTGRAGIGFVMSYYEFTQEGFNRLTDSEWQEWAQNDNLPPRPGWADSFLCTSVVE